MAKDIQPVELSGSSIMNPVDIQARYAATMQTHNAVSVGASATSSSSWIDTQGFDKIAATLINDASTSSNVTLSWSNDGVSNHGDMSDFMPSGTQQRKAAITEIRARYVRVNVVNSDTVAHTMSAWVYLKA
ncbi:hypothetical protein CVD25_01080 [Bacillus canaveralius]|uniref:Uncharacterized protein n=1 Tax=Bacillus canaveralius TaxID=1403243 RepID=A0A2N5GPL9_9BACI|nr:hypothetical protein [Bacillus canaveralius]PLR84657.1 hypothetical protein CU635_06190 [Bacillus canaveralius]PLS00809.1 hypothetical protein CVD25_01080 [Bacillus canaveralius]